MEKKNRMGFGWLLTAGLFLWNPVVGMVDYLPDVIGYLLLLVGISRVADLSDPLGECRSRFQNMVLVAFGELAAQLLIYTYLRPRVKELNPYEQPGWILLFAFLTFAAECYFLIPAFRTFFLGLSTLAERGGATHLRDNRKEKNQYERMATFAVWFVVVKNLCSFLPELTTLTSYEADAENPFFPFNWYSYVGMFRVAFLVPAAIVGVLFLVHWILLFREARKDGVWLTALGARYDAEVLPDVGLLLNRRVNASFLLFRLGMIFTACFAVRTFDLLPDWGAILLFLSGLWLLRKLQQPSNPLIAYLFAVAGVSIAQNGLHYLYFRTYTAKDARYVEAAYDRYLILRLFSGFSILLVLAAVFFILHFIYRLMRNKLSVRYGDGDQTLSEQATERLHQSFRPKFILTAVFASFAAVGKIADLELCDDFAWFWWIPFLLSIIAAIIFSTLLSDLSEHFSEQYPVLNRTQK